MAPATARIGREKRLSTLAKNLFIFEAPGKAAKVRRAERALLRHNPSLATPSGFRPGAVVIVPGDLGFATTPRVERAEADVEGTVQDVQRRLQIAREIAKEAFARGNADAAETTRRLEDRAFRRKLSASSPEAAKRLPEVTKNLKTRLAENEKAQARLSAGITSAIADLDRLRELARGPKSEPGDGKTR